MPRHQFVVRVTDLPRVVAQAAFPTGAYPSVRYTIGKTRSDGTYALELECRYEGVLNQAVEVLRGYVKRARAYNAEADRRFEK